MTTRQPVLHWIDIRDKAPDREVLAINDQDEILIGYVYKEGDDHKLEAEGYTMRGVTHWMDLSELRVLCRLQTVQG
jgi:hypothetical protein